MSECLIRQRDSGSAEHCFCLAGPICSGKHASTRCCWCGTTYCEYALEHGLFREQKVPARGAERGRKKNE